MTTPFTWDLPSDLLEVSELQLGWSTAAPEGAVATARTRIHDYDTEVLIARVAATEGRPGFVVGLKPIEWPLAKALPALADPMLDGLSLTNLALVVTDREIRAASAGLGEAARAFYGKVYQSDQFELVLTPGLNLIAAYPAAMLAEDDPLRPLFERLGIESDVVILQGTLGRSLAAIGGGAVSLDLIKDVYLRASLPKMRPPDAPAWFKSGQLALEITGQPSVGFVGEVTVDLDGDVLVFSVKAKVEKSGQGAAVALVGGLRAEAPWEHPFDLEWLVLYRTVIKISVDTRGTLGLGFAATMILGEKDVDVAIAIRVNSAGTVTNFLFDGESAAGIETADLIALQAAMQPPAGRKPLPPPDLPDMRIEDLRIKFALRDDPDLEVTRGLALRGELFLALSPAPPMTNLGGVDLSIDDNGIVAKGHLAAWSVGAVSWEDALLDLELTLARQALIVSGTVDLGFARQHLDVSLTRKGAFFEAEMTMYDRFRARLAGEAPFTRQSPIWTVAGELESEFRGEVAAAVLERLRAWADDHERAVAVAKAGYDEARERAARAAERLADLEANLGTRQLEAKNAMESAERARDAAARAEARAEQALEKAEADFRATPLRQPKVRAERQAAVVKAKADLAARRTAASAKEAEAQAKRAIYQALTSDAVEEARQEARELAAAAEAAERELAEVEAIVADVRAGKEGLVTVDRAAFAGRLDTIAGGTADLDLDLRFRDQTRRVSAAWDFARAETGAAAVVKRLLRE